MELLEQLLELYRSIPGFDDYYRRDQDNFNDTLERIMQIYQENKTNQPLILAFICKLLTNRTFVHLKEVYGLIEKIIEEYENIDFNCIIIIGAHQINRTFLENLIIAFPILKLQQLSKVNKFLLEVVHDKVAWAHLFENINFNFSNFDEADNMLAIKQLILAWANKEKIDTIRDAEGNTILHLAIKEKGYNFIDFIAKEWPSLFTTINANKQTPLFFMSNEIFLDEYLNNGGNINALDINGDSMLRHVFCRQMQLSFFKELINSGAKYIRNQVEIKTSLHLFVGLSLDVNYLFETRKNLPYDFINKQDEDGRTALHLAIMLKNVNTAKKLLARYASVTTVDRFNRTPLDYAILNSEESLVADILEIQSSIEGNSSSIRNATLISSLVLACYSGHYYMYELIKNHSNYQPSQIDKTIINILDNNELQENLLTNHTIAEQLVILVALDNLKRSHTLEISPHLKKVVPKLVENQGNSFKPFILGDAFGIELELSSIPDVAFVPIEYLLRLFPITSHSDSSVVRSAFTTHFQSEIVSKIIDNDLKLKLFLLVTKYLHEAGTKVNKSTGLHVHVNILGNEKKIPSITARMNLNDKKVADVELILVKQILVNFAAIEPLLRGFIRWGDIFIMPNQHAAMPIASMIESYLKCKSFDELIKIADDRHKSVNVKSLYKYGTLEFRLLEGCTDPVLIKAWYNLITRLVDISIAQTQALILDPEQTPIIAAKNIENLVYILIAERNYPETWDPTWGAPRSADVEASNTDTQLKIQCSPLYKMFLLAKQGADFLHVEEFLSLDQEQKAQTIKFLQEMIELVHQYPGYVEEPVSIDCFNSNLDQYNTLTTIYDSRKRQSLEKETLSPNKILKNKPG